jgi:hypothetical protein
MTRFTFAKKRKMEKQKNKFKLVEGQYTVVNQKILLGAYKINFHQLEHFSNKSDLTKY